jgi:hypothetical protein
MAAISAPSVGPAIVEVFGLRLPVAALILALVGLILSRYIAPKSSRKLSLGQERALTVLLGIILFLIVVGEFPLIGGGKPLGVGMATAWGVGLGTSGLLIVELVGARIMAGFRVALGVPAAVPAKDEPEA